MSTLNEQLTIGLKVLERLRPSLNARRSQESQPVSQETSGTEVEEQVPAEPWPPALATVLEKLGPMPPYSIILGLGEDGLPFLLELTNPAPGSLIITGDAHSGKTRLLHGILASAVFLNDSQHVTFNLIAQDPDDFSTLTLGEHCQESIPAEEESSAEMAALIEELAQLTERRRHGESMEPAVILAIDGLDACLESMDEQFFARLYWLVKHGPRSRVWTIASLAAEHTKHVDPRLVDAFRTRMIGFIADREAAKYLSGDQELDARDLERGAEFYLPYGEGWFRFWACE